LGRKPTSTAFAEAVDYLLPQKILCREKKGVAIQGLSSPSSLSIQRDYD